MQCFSNVFGSWLPLLFSHILWPPPCSFFNTYDIITIMIITKCISQEIQQTITTSLPQRCISWHLISNCNWISQTILMQRLALQQYDQLRNSWFGVWQCWSYSISSSTFLWFRVFVLMWTRVEKPHSQRNAVASRSIFEKPVQTVAGMIHPLLTRTEKVTFHEK